MYFIHNEGKSVAAKRFNRTLKSKIYKYSQVPYNRGAGIVGGIANLSIY